MPLNLLERRIQAGLPSSSAPLNSNQILADQSLQQASDVLSDPIALAAMGTAPLFGKLARMGCLAGSERIFGRMALASWGARGASAVVGLGAEAGAYEAIQRGLHVTMQGADTSLLHWDNFKEGLAHSFVSIGVLKSVNGLVAGTNPILGHFAADGAMVASHQAAAALGMMPRPSESWLSQFIQAEAMNWQMKGGMSLFQRAVPSMALRERALDLEWDLWDRSAERPERLVSLESMAAEGVSAPRSASEKRLGLRSQIDEHLRKMASYLADQVAQRRFRRESFLPFSQQVERILTRLYPEQEASDFHENERLFRAADQFHRVLELWNPKIPFRDVTEVVGILEEGLNGKLGMLFVEQHVREFCRKHALSTGGRKKNSATVEVSAPREIKPYNLRDYQQQMVENLYEDAMSEASPWLGLASPMQTGKSFLAGPAIQRLREVYGPKARFIVLTSAKVITQQVVGDLLEGFDAAEVGRYDANTKQIRRVTVASVHTLIRHLEEFKHEGPTILINDEAYSTQSPMFRAIYTHFGLGEVVGEGRQSLLKPKAGNGIVLGLSGTGAGLEGYKISGQLNILDAITKGWIRHMQGDRVLLSIPAEKRQSVEERDMIWWPATGANAEILADIYDSHLYGVYRRNAVFVPTIKHAELLRDALRKRHGQDYAFALHSEMDQRGEAGSLDRDFDRVIEHWEREGGAVISIGQLNRGYRGKGIDACFHTYESSSSELFGQRTGRGWAGTPGEEAPDYYVLEVTWNRRSRYANLARLLGLVDYPLRSFSSRGLVERLERANQARNKREELDVELRERRVAPLFEGIPLVRIWREAFQEALERAGGLNALAERSGLPLEVLTGFALGGLPVHFEAVLAMKDFIEKDALEFWVHCWREAAGEIREGIQTFEDRFSDDLVRWMEGQGDFHALKDLLQKYFPLPKTKPMPKQQPAGAPPADDRALVEAPKPVGRGLGPGKPARSKESLDLDPLLSEDLRRKLETPIFALPVIWSEGCKEFFRSFDIQFVADVVQWMEQDLKQVGGFGRVALKQVKDALWELDLMLGMEVKRKDPEHSEARTATGVEAAPIDGEGQDSIAELLAKPIGELPLPIKTMNALMIGEVNMYDGVRYYPIHTVGDLLQQTGAKLLKLRGFGATSLKEVKEVLASMGLRLRGDVTFLLEAQASDLGKSGQDLINILQTPLNMIILEFETLYAIQKWNAGASGEIITVGELLKMGEERVRTIDGLTPLGFRELEKNLALLGLSFGMRLDNWQWPPLEKRLDIAIADLSWSVRTSDCLLKAEIQYMGELVQSSPRKLLNLKNFGKKSLEEVLEQLALYGLSLEMNVGDWEKPEEPSPSIAPETSGMMDPSLFDKPVDIFEFSARAHNVLENSNIRYVGELVQKSEEYLSRLRNSGRRTAQHIQELLSELDLSLGMTLPDWKPPVGREQDWPDLLSKNVHDLGLSKDLTRALRKMGILYIEGLVTKTEESLLSKGYISKGSLQQIKESLSRHGLSLGMAKRGEEPPTSD